MKKFLHLVCCLIFTQQISAQYQIEENEFGNYLFNAYPGCVSYDGTNYTLDTTCVQIINEDSLVTGNYHMGLNDLNYFQNLKYLGVFELIALNGLNIPTSVEEVGLGQSYIINPVIQYPPNLKKLSVNNLYGVSDIGIIPNTVETIDIRVSELTLNNIPDSLIYFSWVGDASSTFNLPLFSNAQHLKYFKYESIWNFGPFSSNIVNSLNDSLTSLNILCDSIESIQYLPSNLQQLVLISSETKFISIEQFPANLTSLTLYGNYLCLPKYPESLIELDVTSDDLPFCHPNFLPGLSLGMGMELCSDPSNNVNNCTTECAIIGQIFHDVNGTCYLESSFDLNIKDIPVMLFDDQNNFLKKMYSDDNGFYAFSIPDGTYKIVLDTTETNLKKSCSNQYYEYSFTLDAQHSFVEQNFALMCDSLIINQLDSFDVKINNIIIEGGQAVPNFNRLICINSEDFVFNEQLNCNSAINFIDSLAHFEVKITGPVTFADTSSWFSSSSSNDTITLTYTDTLDNYFGYRYFCFQIHVDSTAQIGDLICVEAEILAPPGDMNAANNSLTNCFIVGTSYDPNYKETYPFYVQPGFDDPIRYTIHFQNTGTAPAINVQLIDTLDSQLDLSSFKVINSSHDVTTSLNGNRLIFKFININLPDSSSNPAGSQGYVEYEITPTNPMVLDDKIFNTAYIYFDFNDPIITNTSENWCTNWQMSVADISKQQETITLYPNPLGENRIVNIQNPFASDYQLSIHSINGTVVSELRLKSDQKTLDLSGFKPGIYLLKFTNEGQQVTKKLVVL